MNSPVSPCHLSPSLGPPRSRPTPEERERARRNHRDIAHTIRDLYVSEHGHEAEPRTMCGWARDQGLVNARDAYYAEWHL